MNVFKMAWRNVGRSRRRSFITTGAMTFALWILLQYSGLIQGYMLAMENNIVDLAFGDIQVAALSWEDDPSLYSSVPQPGPLIDELERAGFRASARLLGAGLGAAGDTASGVMLVGLDVQQDATTGTLHTAVDKGAWLSEAKPNEVVIGRRLARTLGLGVGDELVVLSQAADGAIANGLYQIRGVMLGVNEGVDRRGVWLTQVAFRELMAFPEGAHQIVVRRPQGTDLTQATAEVRSMASGLAVKSWRELMPELASLFDTQKGAVWIMFIIVYIVIGLLLLNTMLMAVFERVRELGVLKAIGVSPGAVFRLVVTESAIQVMIAIVAGTLLALPGMYYLTTTGIDMLGGSDMSIGGVAFNSVWKAEVNQTTFSGPIMMLVIIVGLAIIYPAVKAALIRPVEAMRHQ